jgi:transcription-repair coupling factor (superfamily II helicase)
MSSAPSLALRSLLTGVLRETGLQSPTRRLSGASSPVRSLAVAAASKRLSEGTILLVVPLDADIENTVGDICFFLSVLEGSADAVVSQQVLPFPSTQVDPYRGFQPHLKVASARARVLHALGTGMARVVVASAAALLTKVPDPASVLLASAEIKPGVDLDPHDLANTLVMGG